MKDSEKAEIKDFLLEHLVRRDTWANIDEALFMFEIYNNRALKEDSEIKLYNEILFKAYKKGELTKDNQVKLYDEILAENQPKFIDTYEIESIDLDKHRIGYWGAYEYMITDEGKEFYNSGGFTKRLKDKIKNDLELKKLRNDTTLSGWKKNTFWLLLILGIPAIVYALIKIYDWLKNNSIN